VVQSSLTWSIRLARNARQADAPRLVVTLHGRGRNLCLCLWFRTTVALFKLTNNRLVSLKKSFVTFFCSCDTLEVQKTLQCVQMKGEDHEAKEVYHVERDGNDLH
jgi:hypothetical protein